MFHGRLLSKTLQSARTYVGTQGLLLLCYAAPVTRDYILEYLGKFTSS